MSIIKAKRIKLKEQTRDNYPLRNSHNLNRIRRFQKNLDRKNTQMTLGC